MSRDLGTLDWCRRTGGRLSAADRRAMLFQGVLVQLGRLPAALAARLGLRPDAPLDVDPFAAPATAVTRAAEAAVAAYGPEPLVHHVYRSYAFGRILAAGRHWKLDEELFYAAALLHDLGLVLEAERRPERSCCFAWDGAEAALRVVREAGMDERRAAGLADAVALHLNVHVGLRHGREAHLLNQATALDVVGLGRRRIPPPLLARVLREHPRTGWNEAGLALLAEDLEHRPGSRIHFLDRRFGFVERAARVRW